MRTTLTINDDLIRTAQEFSGGLEGSALIREALKSYIARESARRLAALGGTMPWLEDIPRRREAPTRVAERRKRTQVSDQPSDTVDASSSENPEGKRVPVVPGRAKK